MAHFKQQFRVDAPLADVWRLHEDPNSLADLTPPPVGVRIIQMDQPLKAGARLSFRLGIGPIGALWDVIYDEFEPYQPGMTRCGFVDRELRGPFHSWGHRHAFQALGDNASMVIDEAQFELFGGAAGKAFTWLAVWPAIALLFAFRRFKTRRMLTRHA